MKIRKNYLPSAKKIAKKGMYQAMWGGHTLDRLGETYFGYEKPKNGGKKKQYAYFYAGMGKYGNEKFFLFCLLKLKKFLVWEMSW